MTSVLSEQILMAENCRERDRERGKERGEDRGRESRNI
jgi:hypothetical protein